MYISGHAFGITTDIDVSTLGDHVPDFDAWKWAQARTLTRQVSDWRVKKEVYQKIGS